MWIKRSVLLIAAISIAACDDDPLVPSEIVGVYELVSVNGQPLPWSSPRSSGSGVITVVDGGHLHLRSDGTFGMGISSNTGFFMGGVFRDLDGPEVQLFPTADAQKRTAIVAGDSAVVEAGWRYGFRRSTAPETSATGSYVLASVNGHALPFIEEETSVSGIRRVRRFDYDSLEFVDPLFYRRRILRTEISYGFAWLNGDSLVARVEQTSFGRHDVMTGGVVLHPYPGIFEGIRHDTLWSNGSELVRLRKLDPGTQEERYVPR